MKTAMCKNLTIFLAAACAALTLTVLCPLTAKASAAPAGDVISKINSERIIRAMPALVMDEALTEAARVRSAELPVKMSHTRPNGEPWYTVNSLVQYGETIGYETPVWGSEGMQPSIASMWMRAPAHKALLMDPAYRTIGIAYTEAPNGRVYWAAELGF